MVAEPYRQRWQVELPFRWLKVGADFAHLCGHSRNGVTPAFHVAVAAALPMVLRAGRPPSKCAYDLLGFAAAGPCDVEGMLPILERRERERRSARAALAWRRNGRPEPPRRRFAPGGPAAAAACAGRTPPGPAGPTGRAPAAVRRPPRPREQLTDAGAGHYWAPPRVPV